ncbi:MAG: UDP-N-acetylglucosamine--N-acetylmuramyl-(pentapeptide) pyrophosphoryl-undecaprenol N-acetylglucosamine transferase [Anaerolineae bacterium]|nr:UDP-N-acetylglucosamine--N-acetylmuramyl-(pentapeptide) pyrophosphoryl-undecaprenol N-acetylglucosamine transferase [Anaerolineae bacterium]
MRLLVSGGGTGGHVYPAIVVIESLRRLAGEPSPRGVSGDGGLEALFVGCVGGLEEGLAQRAGLPFVAITAGGLHGLAPWAAARNAAKLAVGTWQARRIVRRFRPHAVLLTGGYVGVPVAAAAWASRVPSLVYLPDIEPALSVRMLARLARRIAVTVPASQAYFPPGKTVVTGYPVRPEFHNIDRETARRALGLEADLPVLLVFGGSRGARSLNRALASILEPLLALYQVVHISGALDAEEAKARREALYQPMRGRYHLYDYLHEEMGQALAAADLAVSRAGASTLGEFPLFGLPAILVPYPYAWRYQRVNADYLMERGCAVRLDDERLASGLLPLLQELLADRQRLAEMSRRARALARPDAADRIAAELLSLMKSERAG